ncbi:MAG TPA: hypothetical protein VNV37_08730, partial [Solirubrobacteraceae bacterium]|nr:hypothetical protein [Solirubrobacteraceae bacterium]
IFNHRPGRFAAEPRPREDEWERIAAALRALRDEGVGAPALPSDVLDLLNAPGAGHELALEAPAEPIPVKKQTKYNVTRWAVSGRDDIGINTRCWRLYERIRADARARPDDWRALCEVWASDFRTHVTDPRWRALLARLEELERQLSRVAAPMAASPRTAGWPAGAARVPGEDPPGSNAARVHPDGRSNRPSAASRDGESPLLGAAVASRDGDSLRLCAGPLDLRLNARRGLAIEAFADAHASERPLFGMLEHGYFPTIELGADFYSGHLVQESPLTHKVTDLERVLPEVGHDVLGRLCARASIDTELGPVEKAVALDPAAAAVELTWTLRWRELPLGSLRFGHLTLLPEAFDARTLWYATHNGGAHLDLHRIGGQAFDHGAAVSALVSCRQGLGMTEGVVLVGDAERALRVEIDQACARALGLVSFTPGAERWLLRLCFTLTESDDTRRGAIARDPEQAPQRMRLRISAHRTGALAGGARLGPVG